MCLNQNGKTMIQQVLQSWVQFNRLTQQEISNFPENLCGACAAGRGSNTGVQMVDFSYDISFLCFTICSYTLAKQLNMASVWETMLWWPSSSFMCEKDRGMRSTSLKLYINGCMR